MRCANRDLFNAYWTATIHEEWINALVRAGRYTREKLEHVRNLMDSHVPNAKVEGYECLIEGLALPDKDDRQVLAAATKCKADAIVTFNQKDFPTNYLLTFQIEVIHPDDFIYYQIDMAPAICCKAFKDQRSALKNPVMNMDEFLTCLQKQQLPQTVSLLKNYSVLI
ncbi:MAG TPA: PIN domain-containing protein [Ferrovaceae bacterium]|nr:PIN domain-containing protein [Ferrovaceae bacterium]HQU07431.1 PIN domain-containing protein [Ferrovaceae bacterium]